MVGYIKGHFFQRYRAFESLAHLNQQAELWLAEEADRRVHGTLREVVAARFAREAPQLQGLPALRFDTGYRYLRKVGWDGYIDLQGNRYSVPDSLCGQQVVVLLSLAGQVTVFDLAGQKMAEHRLTPAAAGWQSVPEHHRRLWQETLRVQARDLAVYEELV